MNDAPAPRGKAKMIRDHEIATVQRIFEQFALLDPQARRRVLAYVSARMESLPVLAAVGGGTEDESARARELFTETQP